MAVLDLSQIKTLTTQMQTEILESPAFLSAELLSKYGIRTITGLEYKDLQFVSKRKGGTTRPYYYGAEANNGIGKLDEVELVVKPSWNRYVDNIEDYREKEPFHVDANNQWVAPNSTEKIRTIGKNYTEDVLAPLFYGMYDKQGANKGLSLYDGLLKHISDQKDDLKVVETGDFSPVTDTLVSGNWSIFTSFIQNLPATFKKAMRGNGDGVIILMSNASKSMLLDSYCRTYPALKPTEVTDVETSFLNLPKVTVVGCDLLGEGSLMLAVLPGNLDFAVDSLGNHSSVEVDKMNGDFKNIIWQINSAQGTRVIDITKVCVNDAKNTFTLGDYVGDYLDEDDEVTMEFDGTNGLVKKA